jgi:hypothetical protein
LDPDASKDQFYGVLVQENSALPVEVRFWSITIRDNNTNLRRGEVVEREVDV